MLISLFALIWIKGIKAKKIWSKVFKSGWRGGGRRIGWAQQRVQQGKMRGWPTSPQDPPLPSSKAPPPTPATTRASRDARCSRGASLVAPGTPEGMPAQSQPLSFCVSSLGSHFLASCQKIIMFANPSDGDNIVIWGLEIAVSGLVGEWGSFKMWEDGTWKDFGTPLISSDFVSADDRKGPCWYSAWWAQLRRISLLVKKQAELEARLKPGNKGIGQLWVFVRMSICGKNGIGQWRGNS